MKRESLAALAALMMAVAPGGAQTPKATPAPLPMATSISLDVRQVASRKKVDDAFNSQGVGSYDKTFARERVIEIAVRTTANSAEEVIVRTWFIGKGAISTTNSRHVLRQAEKTLKIGEVKETKWEESSGQVAATDYNLKGINYRSYSGSRIDGWIVTVQDAAGKLLAVRASDHPLTLLARTPGALESLPR